MRQHVTVRLVIDHLRVGQRCAITSSFPSVRLAVISAAELTELHLVPLARETAYRIGGDQVSDLLRCGISARLTAAFRAYVGSGQSDASKESPRRNWRAGAWVCFR